MQARAVLVPSDLSRCQAPAGLKLLPSSAAVRRSGGEAALRLPGLCTQMLSKVPAHKFFLGSCGWQWREQISFITAMSESCQAEVFWSANCLVDVQINTSAHLRSPVWLSY